MVDELVIVPELSRAQSLRGWGRLYSRFYCRWSRWRLRWFMFLRPDIGKRLFLLPRDWAGCLPEGKKLIYDEELGRFDFAAKKQEHWRITEALLAGIKDELEAKKIISTRLAIYLTYNYFIYEEFFDSLFKRWRPKKIVLLDDSDQCRAAARTAAKTGMATAWFKPWRVNWFDRWLNSYLLAKEYAAKAKAFIRQSRIKPPPPSQLRRAVFLSVDFSRHLKTLLPFYRYLAAKSVNVWWITDNYNLKRDLAIMGAPAGKIVYWASFAAGLKRQSRHRPAAFIYDPAWVLADWGLDLSHWYYRAAKNLLSACRPRAVVVVSDLRFGERSLALAAKKFRVPSLLVSPNSIFSRDALNRYDTTDKVAVVGDYIKQKVIAEGLPEKKVAVVGDLQASSQSCLTRKEIFRRLGLKGKQKIVLAISFRANPVIPQEEKDEYLRWVSRAVKARAGAALVVKPHPTENRSRVEAELKRLGLRQALISDNRQLSLADLLATASVVVETWSMTIFEAIEAGRPVICVNPFNKQFSSFLPIISRGGAVEVKSEPQLRKWLKVLLDRDQPETRSQLQLAKKALSLFIRPNDRRAVQRVAKLLGI